MLSPPRSIATLPCCHRAGRALFWSLYPFLGFPSLHSHRSLRQQGTGAFFVVLFLYFSFAYAVIITAAVIWLRLCHRLTAAIECVSLCVRVVVCVWWCVRVCVCIIVRLFLLSSHRNIFFISGSQCCPVIQRAHCPVHVDDTTLD